MSTTDLVLEGVALLTSLKFPTISAVFSGAKLTRGAIHKAFPDADDRVADYIAEEIHQAVFTVIPEINKRVQEIEDTLGDTPSATQAAQVWSAFVSGFANAKGRKESFS